MQLSLLVKTIESDYMKKTFPILRVGSIIRVDVIIQEGNKKRVQSYTGLLAKYHKAGLRSTITVKRFAKVSRSRSSIGVTRIFPIYSPDIQAIKLITPNF